MSAFLSHLHTLTTDGQTVKRKRLGGLIICHTSRVKLRWKEVAVNRHKLLNRYKLNLVLDNEDV